MANFAPILPELHYLPGDDFLRRWLVGARVFLLSGVEAHRRERCSQPCQVVALKRTYSAKNPSLSLAELSLLLEGRNHWHVGRVIGDIPVPSDRRGSAPENHEPSHLR